MLSDEAITGYVNGCADQFEWNYDNERHIKRKVYYATFDVIHSEEHRKEFNRRFNAIIEYHSKLHRDETPEERTLRSHYSWRYYSFYTDIMRLLELFPDAAPDDYPAVLKARDYYEKKAMNDRGHWRNWPNLHERE